MRTDPSPLLEIAGFLMFVECILPGNHTLFHLIKPLETPQSPFTKNAFLLIIFTRLRFCYALPMTQIEYLRQFRIGEFAIFDFTAAFLGMFLLAPLLSWLFKKMGILVPLRNWVILMLPISVLAHILVGTYTPLTKQFLDPSGHYLTKMVIVACCIFSLMGIKRVTS